ncbi:MAG: hypothetical protein HY849_03485 [Nitrosomonadales bacterium]|nr:hypothetical protein [Nitrosomonadales bacterium]
MINLLLGPPGGGKSYEATVYHVLPALAKGRKIITNLPLDLDRIELHIVAFLSSPTKSSYHFEASQNGQHAFFLTQEQLTRSGYLVTGLSDCSAKLRFNEFEFYTTCDVARQGLAPNIPSNS